MWVEIAVPGAERQETAVSTHGHRGKCAGRRQQRAGVVGDRWVALDPCEAAVDMPHLYGDWGTCRVRGSTSRYPGPLSVTSLPPPALTLTICRMRLSPHDRQDSHIRRGHWRRTHRRRHLHLRARLGRDLGCTKPVARPAGESTGLGWTYTCTTVTVRFDCGYTEEACEVVKS